MPENQPYQDKNQPYQDNIVYDYFFPFVGKSLINAYTKVIKPLVLPVILGVAGYFGLDSYMGFNEISKNGISENKLVEIVEEEEKTKEEVTYDYTSVTQKNFNKTHFRLEGRTGKTLEEMENETRNNLEVAYTTKKEKTKAKYDEMIENANKEARKAWSYGDKKKQTSGSYNYIYKLNHNYKHIAGAGKK